MCEFVGMWRKNTRFKHFKQIHLKHLHIPFLSFNSELFIIIYQALKLIWLNIYMRDAKRIESVRYEGYTQTKFEFFSSISFMRSQKLHTNTQTPTDNRRNVFSSLLLLRCFWCRRGERTLVWHEEPNDDEKCARIWFSVLTDCRKGNRSMEEKMSESDQFVFCRRFFFSTLLHSTPTPSCSYT